MCNGEIYAQKSLERLEKLMVTLFLRKGATSQYKYSTTRCMQD